MTSTLKLEVSTNPVRDSSYDVIAKPYLCHASLYLAMPVYNWPCFAMLSYPMLSLVMLSQVASLGYAVLSHVVVSYATLRCA